MLQAHVSVAAASLCYHCFACFCCAPLIVHRPLANALLDQKHVPKFQGRVISEKKEAPARKPAQRRPDMGPKSPKHIPKFQGRVISEKKDPCQAACTTSSEFGPKVDFPQKSRSDLMTYRKLKPHAS